VTAEDYESRRSQRAATSNKSRKKKGDMVGSHSTNGVAAIHSQLRWSQISPPPFGCAQGMLFQRGGLRRLALAVVQEVQSAIFYC